MELRFCVVFVCLFVLGLLEPVVLIAFDGVYGAQHTTCYIALKTNLKTKNHENIENNLRMKQLVGVLV